MSRYAYISTYMPGEVGRVLPPSVAEDETRIRPGESDQGKTQKGKKPSLVGQNVYYPMFVINYILSHDITLTANQHRRAACGQDTGSKSR